LLASDFPSENPRTQTRNFPYTTRWPQAEKSRPHKQHIWFLPTQKPALEKTKRAVFCQRTEKNNGQRK